jgi:hypothetical protein
MDQFKKKKTQKRLNGQWKLRKEEKEREKKRSGGKGGKGMHSVKYGANKKNKVYGG